MKGFLIKLTMQTRGSDYIQDAYERKVSIFYFYELKVYLKEQKMCLYKKAIELANLTGSSIYVTFVSERGSEYATFVASQTSSGSQRQLSKVKAFGPTPGSAGMGRGCAFQKWMDRTSAGLADWRIVKAKHQDGKRRQSDRTDELDHISNTSLSKITRLLEESVSELAKLNKNG
jgi:hypothetical protein